jgi:Family of unknown function (DUF6312)
LGCGADRGEVHRMIEDAPVLGINGPITVTVKKKRGKRRYSRGLRDLQTSNRGMTKASRRLVKAVARGMTTYLKESDKSGRKRRDGALRDFNLNVADAIGASLREASGIASDVARSFNTRGWRRSMRRSLKATARFNRRLFRAR